MKELALFAGAGGGLLASRLLGWETLAAVEIDPFCRRVIKARQDGGMLDPFPLFEDVRTFDPNPWRGQVDIVTGGFPCQDISIANNERSEGLDGSKSGLWWDMWRICCEVGSRFLYVENSPELASRGLSNILGALASRGWDAEWIVLGAGHLGAPHARERLWMLAADSNDTRRQERRQPQPAKAGLSEWISPWPSASGVRRTSDGMAPIMDRRKRLRALGNGQVPRVASAAFTILYERLTGEAYC